MIIKDRLFGKIKITEPVILDLMHSRYLQRLKGVDQAGYYEIYYPGTKYNRFEHSIGCYYLLNKFNASIEEQIAGLIHDVSHSVFSHCIDYVLEVKKESDQSYQDNIFKDFVIKSDIPSILKKYNFNLDYILDEKNFPLQETTLPDLCADRIDYSLRGLIAYNEISQKKAQKFINNLQVMDNKWIFNNYKIAYEYAKIFSYLNQKYYCNLETAVMFRTVGDYLKYALENNYIEYDNLYTTDQFVLDKINKNLKKDSKLEKLWNRMNKKNNYKNNKDNFDAKVYCKSRIINPLILQNNQIQRLSKIKPSWENTIESETIPKKYFIKFLD